MMGCLEGENRRCFGSGITVPRGGGRRGAWVIESRTRTPPRANSLFHLRGERHGGRRERHGLLYRLLISSRQTLSFGTKGACIQRAHGKGRRDYYPVRERRNRAAGKARAPEGQGFAFVWSARERGGAKESTRLLFCFEKRAVVEFAMIWGGGKSCVFIHARMGDGRKKTSSEWGRGRGVTVLHFSLFYSCAVSTLVLDKGERCVASHE